MYALSKHFKAEHKVLVVSESRERLVKYMQRNNWHVSPYTDNAFYPQSETEVWCEIERVKTL
jgi:hypothetical protein